jgi:hypothetical protein
MKSSASINLYRRANGDVMGQIIDENGNKVTENFFGKFTEAEYDRLSMQPSMHE